MMSLTTAINDLNVLKESPSLGMFNLVYPLAKDGSAILECKSIQVDTYKYITRMVRRYKDRVDAIKVILYNDSTKDMVSESSVQFHLTETEYELAKLKEAILAKVASANKLIVEAADIYNKRNF